ncbi:class III lanthionine synthetase LanKC [Streptomyces sp. IMTB 1903]|uniref:class III lanthionine synthetase LanKC n=1 Tax=Streptomyces sp. IMTB 1903 TaxID=1776680 RepID=UPI00075A0DAF|nr:class III lanthionine synthetase LanKC [Streptomyces sp. IMTB 1903]
MIEQRHLYGWADPVFYEAPGEQLGETRKFGAAVRDLPDGWTRTARGVWTVLRPPGANLPDQGWKIHVSAVGEDAEDTVSTVSDYCTEHGTAHKFLGGMDLFELFNAKYMPRQGSGKLITVYPADEAELERTLRGLDALLGGRPGPHVLTDLRWNEGPLHVRYGAFRERYLVDERGHRVPALAGPDGTLVPDERKPGCYAPAWVEVPSFLTEQPPASGGGLKQHGYRVLRALHFSNGGGVYLAEREADGRTLVLKEARPGAGLDSRGRDAVARLEREGWALERLVGIEGVPELYDRFTVGGHRFLAMEYVDGEMLWLWLATYHPLLFSGSGHAEEADYADRAMALADRVEQLVDAVHERGVVFGDLHPGNILVTEDGRVGLIDFEAAFPADEPAGRSALGAQGFMAPDGFHGPAVDHYALAALRAWFLLPLNRLAALSPGRELGWIHAAEQRFGHLLAPGVLKTITERLTPPRPADAVGDGPVPPRRARLRRRREELLGLPCEVTPGGPGTDWDAVRQSLAEGILTGATPHRRDRLFPGDAEQFSTDGACFAYGAAGVLWALDAAGRGRYPDHEEWLLERVRDGLHPVPGFYTGLHGTAHVLAGFGHDEEALWLVGQADANVDRLRDPGLFRGLSGIGLNLVHLARRYGDDRLLARAAGLADRVAALVDDPALPGAPGTAQAGLMRGWSGPALFLIRMYEATGDERHLDRAARALGLDLAGCVPQSNGSLQVADRGVRTLAYLDVGSGGIALVADELLEHRDDPALAEAVTGIRRACEAEFVVEPHLLNGRSGLMAVVSRLARRDTEGRARAAVSLHLERLAWHALAHRGHLAFAGEQSYRLSSDLATGSAGILLGITAAVDGAAPFLPFFGPRPVPSGPR